MICYSLFKYFVWFFNFSTIERLAFEPNEIDHVIDLWGRMVIYWFTKILAVQITICILWIVQRTWPIMKLLWMLQYMIHSSLSCKILVLHRKPLWFFFFSRQMKRISFFRHEQVLLMSSKKNLFCSETVRFVNEPTICRFTLVQKIFTRPPDEWFM